jgi:hypothetical protein
MAKLVLRDCFIEVDGVDFSSHVSSVTINLSKDEIDTTNFGGSGRERAHGLKDDSFELTFQQDYAASSVDDTLYPLWDEETEFVVKVRPRQGTGSPAADNPEYSATCVLLEYTPLAGDVGDLSTTDVTFPAQRTGITRATS